MHTLLTDEAACANCENAKVPNKISALLTVEKPTVTAARDEIRTR